MMNTINENAIQLLQAFSEQKKKGMKGGIYDKTLIKLILQLGHNVGEKGFKRNDAFETVENALPGTKSPKEKLRYLGRILEKMNSEGSLRTQNRKWYITEKGESEIRS